MDTLMLAVLVGSELPVRAYLCVIGLCLGIEKGTPCVPVVSLAEEYNIAEALLREAALCTALLIRKVFGGNYLLRSEGGISGCSL